MDGSAAAAERAARARRAVFRGGAIPSRFRGNVVARWGDGPEVDDYETGGVPLALADAPSRHPMVRGRVFNEPGAGMFSAPHGINVDSEGSFYVADTAESWIGLDRGSRAVQKFVRV